MSAHQMRGTLEKCLKHFRAEAGSEEAACEQLVNFTHGQIKRPTASRWVRGQNVPKGFNLLQLWYFLESKGCLVDKVERLQPEVADLGRLVAYQIVEPAEVNSIIGFAAHGDNGFQQLWQLLKGDRSLVPVKAEIAQLLIEEHEDKLKSLRSKAGTQTDELHTEQTEAAPRPTAEPAMEANVSTLIPIAVAFLMGLKPILKQLAAAGEETHQQLRDAVGGDDAYYDVLDPLKQMSSRRANRFFREH